MLNNSKKVFAIALAVLFLSTPLMSTASAAAPDFGSPQKLELRSNHHNPSPSHNRGPSHSVNKHRGPSHNVRHAPGPRYASHDRGHHYDHRKPAPPPRRDKHHHHSSGNDKLIGGLIAGAVIGAVIANNT